ncbi:MAG: hypothetical protein IT264_03455 [Saprospiraceae bacterium]|nr:hypothetical protein [Saprospiraceae bacterium]
MKSSILMFSPTRFINLFKREWNYKKNTILIVFISVLGGLSVPLILQILTQHNPKNLFTTETLIVNLAIMGVIFASLCFSEFIQTTSKQNYLSIPASALEKLLSKWFLISLVIPIIYIISYYGYSKLITFSANLFIKDKLEYSIIDLKVVWQFLLNIILVQSVYILGSVWMPKNSILKTSFGLFAILIFIAIFSFICFRITFHEYFTGLVMTGSGPNITINGDIFFESPIIRKLTGIVIFLFIMTVSLFKLREKQL